MILFITEIEWNDKWFRQLAKHWVICHCFVYGKLIKPEKKMIKIVFIFQLRNFLLIQYFPLQIICVRIS